MQTASGNASGGPERDHNDFMRLRHGRDRHVGFPVGKYLQPPPLLFTRDGHNAFLGDMYRGRAAFLLCGGPSLKSHDLKQLERRGVLTLAVNNAAVVFRSQLWCSVDDPSHFADAIWKDPGITKFIPMCHMEKPIHVRDGDGFLVPSKEKVGDMPAVFGFRRNEAFDADQWLFEDTFNWGNHSKRVDADGNKGSRSVMYVALRLLFHLGIRDVFLLGCDFKMQTGQANYAFDQERSAASVRSNNQTYQILNRRLEKLLPHFEEHDFHVFNCTPDSGLTVFPHVAFEDAVASSVESFPKTLLTSGLYDGAARRPTVNGTPRESAKPYVGPAPDPDKIPKTTLIVPLDAGDADEFAATWLAWKSHHPWLATSPLLLVSHERSVLSRSFDGVLPSSTRRLFVEPRPSEVEDRPGECAATVLEAIDTIETEWWLKLDADVSAVPHDPVWPNPAWFAAGSSETSPVLIGHRWGSVRTGSSLDDLDEWASRHAGLKNGPPFPAPMPRTIDRLSLPTISSWCLFGNTKWATQLLGKEHTEPPDVPLQVLLHYGAVRSRRSIIRVDMKSFGWTHSFAKSARRRDERAAARRVGEGNAVHQSSHRAVHQEVPSCPR